jgi:hypothetical protein
MLLSFALIVVLVVTAASALPAESHEWYAGLRSPSGMPCCNERDCHPVAYRVNHDTGDEEIRANGAWYPVVTLEFLLIVHRYFWPTPRGRSLTCIVERSSGALVRPLKKAEALGQVTWRSWFVFLRALFGLPIEDEGDLATYTRCTGRALPSGEQAEEAWLVCGRRSGKSFMLALIAVYLATFKSWKEYRSWRGGRMPRQVRY